MKAAQRIAVHPWRDPRLLLGIMLVLLSTVVGAKLFEAQDDTEAYWSVRASVVAGDSVERENLVSTRVRLGSATRGSYVQVKDEFPARISDLVWARDVSAGSLLEGSALVVDGEQAAGELPLNVASGSYPLDLRGGESVDVWVGPGPGEPTEDKSALVLRAAPVLSTGGGSTAAGGSLARTILVGVADGMLADKTLSAISAGHVTLVRVP